MRARTASSAAWVVGGAAALAPAGTARAAGAAAEAVTARGARRTIRRERGGCGLRAMRLGRNAWTISDDARRKHAVDGTNLRHQLLADRAVGIDQRVGILGARLV